MFLDRRNWEKWAMPRGRPAKSNALKIAEGVRKQRINFDEPVYRAGSCEPPGWLWGYGLEHWNELAPLLSEAGCLSEGDRAALAMLCADYDQWRSDPDCSAARVRYIRMLTEFGLTPSSRARVKRLEPKPADRLAMFLGPEENPKPAVK
jgi:phage terminase small subunit